MARVYLPGLISSARILITLLPTVGFLLSLQMAIMLHRHDIVDHDNRVVNVQKEDMFKYYDFIIIGAGSAGAVLANRLSENPKWNVLLLEAGKDEHVLADIPFAMPALHITEMDWQFTTEKDKGYCLAMRDGICAWPRGKVLGGCSTVNAMLYIRGNKKDYDSWEKMGNPGWSYESVLPYFKKSEDMKIPEFMNGTYHGTGGYLTVEKYKFKLPITKLFLDAGKDLGYDIRDVNGEKQTGFTESHGTLRNGLRCSTAKAFLRSASKRKNLHVSTESHVEKILINDRTKRAHGVLFNKNGEKVAVYSNREVILSAGSIQSPQILMLSGIGEEKQLKEHGIKVKVNLPGVGYNLQDHVAMGGRPYLYDEKHKMGLNLEHVLGEESIRQFAYEHDGPLYDLPECEAMAFVNTKYANKSEDWPDIQLFLGAFSDNADGGLFWKRDIRLGDDSFASIYEDIIFKPAYSAVPLLLRPKSRGYIKLKSKDPYDKPLIYPNYYTHPQDIKVMVKYSILYKIIKAIFIIIISLM